MIWAYIVSQVSVPIHRVNAVLSQLAWKKKLEGEKCLDIYHGTVIFSVRFHSPQPLLAASVAQLDTHQSGD